MFSSWISRTLRSAQETASARAAKTGSAQSFEIGRHGGFRARGGDGREVDGEAAVGERARGGPGGLSFVERRDQDDGPSDFGERVVAIIGLRGFDGFAGGDGAESLGDFDRNAMDVVEDENPIVQGELEELAIADGEAAEGSGGGIDQGAERAGEDGFAAGGGASENEDGVGSDGAEGGGEPEQHAGVGGGREMEQCGESGQGVGDWGLGIGRRGREGEHAWGVAEGMAEVVGDGPALGGDFEDFAGGVCQVEEDFGWGDRDRLRSRRGGRPFGRASRRIGRGLRGCGERRGGRARRGRLRIRNSNWR